MSEQEPNIPALKREWLAARIVAVLGILLLAAIAAVMVLDGGSVREMPPAMPSHATAPTPDAEARRQEDIALCNAALSTAQATGIVPAFAARDGDTAVPGGVQGRYVCGAKTDAAKYAITFDLACTHLGDANCIVLFNITLNGNGVLYQRK
jgi:hypothetical protein